MKDKTLARLQLLAAAQNMKILEEISRQNQILHQAATQRQLLTDYRDKLTQCWRGGDVVEAGKARRAMNFAAASTSAGAQLNRLEHQATHALENARIGFVHSKERQRHLADARHALQQDEERLIDIRLERAQARAAKSGKLR